MRFSAPAGSEHITRILNYLGTKDGADLRYVQQMLGHARSNTTEIYTHVNIQKLIEVHRLTHPAKLPEQGLNSDLKTPRSDGARNLADDMGTPCVLVSLRERAQCDSEGNSRLKSWRDAQSVAAAEKIQL